MVPPVGRDSTLVPHMVMAVVRDCESRTSPDAPGGSGFVLQRRTPAPSAFCRSRYTETVYLPGGTCRVSTLSPGKTPTSVIVKGTLCRNTSYARGSKVDPQVQYWSAEL